MAININNLGNNNPIKTKVENQEQVKQQAAKSAVNVEQVKTARQDSVSITPQAKQLSELQKKAADGPAVDQKKIDELKKEISEGSYKVDPEKLAANIAGFEFELDGA